MNKELIRNFCIIAHIDHGKSTLADRFLELTGTVEKRNMKEQLLDSMDLERERGITIKLQPARMYWEKSNDAATNYELNLIDTPGHVDFSYEVSRSLAAVEGALVLVDATQGVQAQTLANVYLALEQKLTIIPVINKIDLPAADISKCEEEIIALLGIERHTILRASGKTGEGVAHILDAIVERIPPPQNMDQDDGQSLRALIFDSFFDDYRGVITYVRMFQGSVRKGDRIQCIATKSNSEVLEVGAFKPHMAQTAELQQGEIGYIVIGLKEISQARVGDTITFFKHPVSALPGYKTIKPMVFAGLFCKEGSEFPRLREALEKLQMSDAALQFEPENSPALGFGFRCGFLGMLHLDIISERIKREFGIELIITVPSVAYKVTGVHGELIMVTNPMELPDPGLIQQILEPWMSVDIVTPESYIGAIMRLAHEKRGVFKTTEYISRGKSQRVILRYELPLSALLVDFYDTLKGVSSGYASLNYDFVDYRLCNVVKLEISVAEDSVDALASIVYADEAYHIGKNIVARLKSNIPKAMFEIKIQAMIGAKIIASERISAMRKDVTAKLYGGDVTRKMKLLKKQKQGKKKMQGVGRVDIPTKAFLEILKR